MDSPLKEVVVNAGKAKKSKKTIEERYQKKSQLEHILLRPDTYVGSIEHHEQQMWIFDEPNSKMVLKKILYVPGLYKIFDEILVNAADNRQRDTTMKNLKVVIDKENCMVSVYNDGLGIPVEIHKEHQVYVPEMIFGQLLTGDNYDDDEKRVTGGRNGYGAKLANIFSKKFIVECGDSSRKRKFKMTWSENMSKKTEPVVCPFSDNDYVKVTFYPDLERFQMPEGFDDDIVALFSKRVYDIAGSSDRALKVSLNGTKLPINDFKDYVDMYLKEKEEVEKLPRISEKTDRWELVATLSDGAFQQVSFVNSICTIKGGTHVTHVADQLISSIQQKITKKNKGGMGIQELVLNWANVKQQAMLQRKVKGSGRTSRLTGIPKLEDANDAGTKLSELCTLILTEGDSAKTSCVAGLQVVGRDRFGVFPLKGKLLNVRDANHKQLLKNEEIQNIMKITGLDVGRKIDSPKGLRYGSIMIMTDQDHDGSHIKGLLINFIHHYWPDLIKHGGFLREFITPIVKVWKGTGNRKQEHAFFTLPEYEAWRQENNDGKGWELKYYKGLGTSTDKEFMEYFAAYNDHLMNFSWESQEDDEAIDMAFNGKRAEDRKYWINGYEEGTFVDHTASSLSYVNFINKELVLFSRYDLERSVPSVVDGLKPSQRKVLFSCFKRKLVKDIKVAQLVGYVAEVSAYHHGEKSLSDTIVGMAQNFLSSNNINLLEPSGQFGSRKEGGKDSASARYIFTRLSSVARRVFHEDDDALLAYQSEEGQWIEPKWYMPVIPLVLVNGAIGIGTGWSTSIPNYNPREIIWNLKRYLQGEDLIDMDPWYRWFEGEIVKSAKGGYETIGKYKEIDDENFEIEELPIKMWTSTYKEFLEELLTGKDNSGKDAKEPYIKDFRDNSGHHEVEFTITLTRDKMKTAIKEGIDKKFKLRSQIALSNMTLFGPDGKIYRYDGPLDIIKEFAQLRLTYYGKRKDFLVGKLTRERDLLDAKARFILMVINGELKVNNRKKKDILVDLQKKGFQSIRKLKEGEVPSFLLQERDIPKEDPEEEEESEDPNAIKSSDYDYLLGMALWSLTLERVEEMRKQLQKKQAELDDMMATTVEMLWLRDLDALLEAIEAADLQYWNEMNQTASMQQKSTKGKAKGKAKAKAGLKRKKSPSDDEDDAPKKYKTEGKGIKQEAIDDMSGEPSAWADQKPKTLFDRLKSQKGASMPPGSNKDFLKNMKTEPASENKVVVPLQERLQAEVVKKYGWSDSSKHDEMKQAAAAARALKAASIKTSSSPPAAKVIKKNDSDSDEPKPKAKAKASTAKKVSPKAESQKIKLDDEDEAEPVVPRPSRAAAVVKKKYIAEEDEDEEEDEIEESDADADASSDDSDDSE
eukprot:GHVL01025239.1.p1 GENE.GHVL01025239.1~~GHVL01025239.1.p1  ORF type:complete len:1371 (-),score=291.64 GHVL01025239.1:56-4168(-)